MSALQKYSAAALCGQTVRPQVAYSTFSRVRSGAFKAAKQASLQKAEDMNARGGVDDVKPAQASRLSKRDGWVQAAAAQGRYALQVVPLLHRESALLQ